MHQTIIAHLYQKVPYYFPNSQVVLYRPDFSNVKQQTRRKHAPGLHVPGWETGLDFALQIDIQQALLCGSR